MKSSINDMNKFSFLFSCAMLISIFSSAQQRVETIKINYKPNRFFNTGDVDNIKGDNSSKSISSDDTTVYLVDEFSKQVTFGFDNHDEDTLYFGYSLPNEKKSAIVLGRFSKTSLNRDYGIITGKSDLLLSSVSFDRANDKVYLLISSLDDTITYMNNGLTQFISIPRSSMAFTSCILVFHLSTGSLLAYSPLQTSNRLPSSSNLQSLEDGVRMTLFISIHDSLLPSFQYLKNHLGSRFGINAVFEMDSLLIPNSRGFLSSPKISLHNTNTSYATINSFTDIDISYTFINLSSGIETVYNLNGTDKWTTNGILLKFDHTNNVLDSLTSLKSVRFKQFPDERISYDLNGDILKIIGSFDSVGFIGTIPVYPKVEQINNQRFNKSYIISTRKFVDANYSQLSSSGSYLYHHQNVFGNIVDSFDLSYNDLMPFVSDSRTIHAGQAHVLAKYSLDGMNIQWARSTTFTNLQNHLTQIHNDDKNLIIYGDAVSPFQDLDPEVKGNALVENGRKLVVYNCVPIAYFGVYPNQGNQVKFLNLSDRNATYKWYFTSSDSSDELHPIHRFSAFDSTYIVTLIATNECGADTFSRTVYLDGTRMGIEEIADEYVTIYPNPANASVSRYLKLSNSKPLDNEAKLFGTNGKVWPVELVAKGEGLYQFSVDGLPVGLYFIRVRQAEQIMHSRVLVR